MELHPDNPAYIAAQTQLKTIDTEIQSNWSRKKRLQEKLLDYEERVAKSPQVEKDFMELVREQQSALAVLIDPAQFPEKPVKPMLLSLVFAVVAGLGVAILKEAMDGSIRGIASINKIISVAPLAVIPVIYNTYDLRRKQRIYRIVIGSIIGSVIVVVLLVHFFWTPLDVLWFRGLRKAENVMGV